MGGTPIVIALVGLVFPITLILLAVLFDIAVLCWAAYRWLRGRLEPIAHAAHAQLWPPHIVVRWR
jgi:hypothetical protein